MVTSKIFLFLLIILILLFIIFLYYKYHNYESFIEYRQFDQDFIIPKVIYQTYISIDRVPQKVFNNLKKYSSNYDYQFYNDNDCLQFLEENYGQEIVNTYNILKVKAHKADLFRYCLLYKYGGIYLDIKTELILPISDYINSNYTYTVICSSDTCIYQGVMATKKRNPIFPILIKQIVNTVKNNNNKFRYHTFIEQFYKLIQNNSNNNGVLLPGINKNYVSNQPDYYLFYEKCTRNPNDCYDGLDRHKYCCFIYDKNKKIIKTRYSDFPW